MVELQARVVRYLAVVGGAKSTDLTRMFDVSPAWLRDFLEVPGYVVVKDTGTGPRRLFASLTGVQAAVDRDRDQPLPESMEWQT